MCTILFNIYIKITKIISSRVIQVRYEVTPLKNGEFLVRVQPHGVQPLSSWKRDSTLRSCPSLRMRYVSEFVSFLRSENCTNQADI